MKDTLKSIAISKETHTLVKEYCDKRALKISSWIDNLVRNEIYKEDDIEKGYDKRKNNK